MASVAASLSQALAVRDDAALDTCFSVQEDAVIASSVAQLNAAHAGALLEALVERLQLQPQQAARLVPWLRSLLLAHGAALAATPAGQAALRLAHQLLQERTASFGGLLSLSGRLQVLQPAGDGCSEAGGAPAARGGATAAKVVFAA